MGRGIMRRGHKSFWVPVLSIVAIAAALQSKSEAQCESANAKVISCVDRSLKSSQKYLLRVDGKPFFMTEIQIRLDKLRYYWGWNTSAREAIVARAAEDGFNTVSIPIHWYEVEPKKDKFDWRILDEYLGMVRKHNLKMELLWFGQNSGGHVQWLGDPATNPVHLRTPDYVLYSSAPRSHNTTSEYTIQRDMSDYTLDLADNRLKERETYVLGRVMAHIASWDRSHGSKHTVIGVQVDNEVFGRVPISVLMSYLSGVASAVKQSKYVVWTRINCVWGATESRIDANEALRSRQGTNIDFVGVDLYRDHFKSDDDYAAQIPTSLPYKGGNYRMIMECGAEVRNASILRLAALSGNIAFDYYDMIGPDEHGLYDRSGAAGFIPHGVYVADVRVVNKLLDSDIVDIATKAQGQGLFAHNWAGNSATATKGADGIVFTPSSTTSQAISIDRSTTEIVLMNTQGGTFTFPQSLGIISASRGYFDSHDHWVQEANIALTGTSISPSQGTTVRLIRSTTE
jgi:hypothetical protein